ARRGGRGGAGRRAPRARPPLGPRGPAGSRAVPRAEAAARHGSRTGARPRGAAPRRACLRPRPALARRPACARAAARRAGQDRPGLVARAHRARRDGRRRGVHLAGAHGGDQVGRRRRPAARVAPHRPRAVGAPAVAGGVRPGVPQRGRRSRRDRGACRRRRGRGAAAVSGGRWCRRVEPRAGRRRAGAGLPGPGGGAAMSVDMQATAPRPTAPGRGTWSLTWHGLRTVTVLELRQRVRSTRWKTALVVWFLVVGLITLLTTGAFSILADDPYNDEPFGGIVYSIVVGFVLFLGLLVAPTLSSGAINGDRNAGTLATLQVTLLTPAEIVLGKLAASWIAALAFLVASIPFLAWALAGGGVSGLALLTTVL